MLDISHPNAPEHVEVVQGIIGDLGLSAKPQVLALNKADLLDPEGDKSFLRSVEGATAVLTSAVTGLGIDELLEAVRRALDPTPVYADRVTSSGRPG